MNWKSEILALVFGMLIILIVFGDAVQVSWVGNLDTIFGLTYWHLMDLMYPLASIVVFLLYGRSKGSIRLSGAGVLLFFVFVIAIAIIQFDDICIVLNHSIELPDVYWTIARWLYLFAALSTFFAFGRVCNNKSSKNS